MSLVDFSIFDQPIPQGSPTRAAPLSARKTLLTTLHVVTDKGLEEVQAADALVLIHYSIACKCGQTQTYTDWHTFLRRGNRFQRNNLDPIFIRQLPKEIKQLRFESEYCQSCFFLEPQAVEQPLITPIGEIKEISK